PPHPQQPRQGQVRPPVSHPGDNQPERRTPTPRPGRQEFNAPHAKFVCGTLGEATREGSGPTRLVLDAHLAVDGTSGKYPEFAGNVRTIFTHPLAQGGSGNGHYGGKAEVYMDVGEAMGHAMVELVKGSH
ncbi:MAG: hypothetical protein ACKOFW_06035, partial [Planctomycetaceae bacterium]